MNQSISEEFSEELQVEVMEDYIRDARFLYDDKENMRKHFEKLKSFIQSKISQAITAERKELRGRIDRMAGTIHTPVGGYSNIEWLSKNQVLSFLEEK